MANPNQVAGRAKIKVDGAVIFAGNVKHDPGGVAREAVSGDFVAGAFRQGEPKPSKTEFDALAYKGFSPKTFAEYDNVTVMIEYDTGRTFIQREAWSEGAPPIDASTGKAACVLMGPPSEEVA
jgi:hypothetical protein